MSNHRHLIETTYKPMRPPIASMMEQACCLCRSSWFMDNLPCCFAERLSTSKGTVIFECGMLVMVAGRYPVRQCDSDAHHVLLLPASLDGSRILHHRFALQLRPSTRGGVAIALVHVRGAPVARPWGPGRIRDASVRAGGCGRGPGRVEAGGAGERTRTWGPERMGGGREGWAAGRDAWWGPGHAKGGCDAWANGEGVRMKAGGTYSGLAACRGWRHGRTERGGERGSKEST